ncbi:uncharacterized protein [Miscanthus floridulus]|uniref:uncharacterized protein n=1 Tax=Miscanthus floridulus TaxID=154761 RepID=UPI003457FB58
MATGLSATAAAAKLHDEATSAAELMEAQAISIRSSNAERSQQLQQEADLLKSTAAALDQERTQADALDQAAAVQNIKHLIPIVLELQSSSNYSKWRDYFLLTLGRFSLRDHVLSDDARPDNPAWSRMDCVVVSWTFNTISPDLLDIVHEHAGTTARAAWLGVENQFLGNHESRALLLDAEFRNLSQGALSIDDYCRQMKTKADALADLGEPISDRTLVLNVLHGLNERFQFMAQLITRQKPFPSFSNVRADLRLAKLNMEQPMAPP